MIATILSQSPDTEKSRNANTASAPLPLIPRRANSASRTNHAKCNDSQTHSLKPPLNIVSKASFEMAATMQSLYPSSCVQPKVSNQTKLEQNAGTSKASQHERLQATQDVQRHLCDTTPHRDTCSHSSILTTSTKSPESTICDCKEGYGLERSIQTTTLDPNHNTKPARLVRKKSGQLVKPSLKSPSSGLKADLSVMTLGKPSKSEPTTPTHAKAVHFDTQLEHVKLFLSQQKPLAVSRDGSPTDDTSGNESDFPSFIYRSCNNKKARRALSMHAMIMPLSVNKSSDVALETLSLTSQGSSVTGKVRLRNIAYHKVLTVRFTFDNWSTINEVTGQYLESIDTGFDRFVFNIKLQKFLLEGKKLIFALRYTVDGREIWDNNMGRDYIATFSRSFIDEDLDFGNASSKMDVPRFLHKDPFGWRGLCSSRNDCDAKSLAAERRAMPSPPEPLQDGFESIFKPSRSASSISSTSCSKAQLCGVGPVVESQQFPLSRESIPNVPDVSFGSPRDLDTATFRPTIHVTFDNDEVAFDTMSYNHAGRHHRRSYFDGGWEAPDVRTTPAVLLFDGVTSLPALGSHSLTPRKGEHNGSQYIPASPSFNLHSRHAIQGLGVDTLSFQSPITSQF